MEVLPGIIIILLGMVGLVLAYLAIDLMDELVRHIFKKWRESRNEGRIRKNSVGTDKSQGH